VKVREENEKIRQTGFMKYAMVGRSVKSVKERNNCVKIRGQARISCKRIQPGMSSDYGNRKQNQENTHALD
jgi:hypothetical protein